MFISVGRRSYTSNDFKCLLVSKFSKNEFHSKKSDFQFVKDRDENPFFLRLTQFLTDAFHADGTERIYFWNGNHLFIYLQIFYARRGKLNTYQIQIRFPISFYSFLQLKRLLFYFTLFFVNNCEYMRIEYFRWLKSNFETKYIVIYLKFIYYVKQ